MAQRTEIRNQQKDHYMIVMLAAATSLAILFALVAAHTGYVFG